MVLSLEQFRKVLFLDRHGYFARTEEDVEDFVGSGPSLFNDISSTNTHPPELVSKFWVRFSLDVRSLPIEVSKKGMLPWEPACCWIDKQGNSFIRVRPKDAHRTVSRDAVLAHEYVHALRARLFSHSFEEICAYTVSAELFPKDFPKWRTWLSPLFSSAKELLFTFLWMIGCWTVPLFLHMEISPFFLFPLSILPVIGYTIRLHKRWKKWNKAQALLSSLSEKSALPILMRLPDEDIEWLAQQTKEGFSGALRKRATTEWRWSFIKEAFLTD